eukprot:99960_1
MMSKMFSPSSAEFWTSLEILIVFICILFPILIYNIYIFAKNKNHVIYQRRYANITISEASICAIQLFQDSIIFIILAYLSTNNNTSETLNTLLLIFLCLNNIFSFTLYFFQFWRFYLLHYEIRFSTAIKHHSWQHLINPKYQNQTLNFYINPHNKKTYGNSKWILCRMIIPLIIISSSLFNIHLFINHFYFTQIKDIIWYHIGSIIFDAILYSLPCTLLYIFYRYMLPAIKFEDIFFVRKELKKLLVYHIFNWLFYLIYRVAIFIFKLGNETGDYNSNDIILIAIIFNLICFMELLMVYTSTNWVRKQLQPFIEDNQNSRYYKGFRRGNHMPLMSLTSISFPSYNDISGNNSSTGKLKKKKTKMIPLVKKTSINSDDDSVQSLVDIKINVNIRIKLGDILSHEKGFESFILYLSSEFSVENMLALVELCQYQKYIYEYLIAQNLMDNNNEFENIFGVTIDWPKSVPRSMIVYGEHDVDDELIYDNDMQFYYICKKKAKQLFEKYIKTSSEYEVNLSYSVRNRLIKLMYNDLHWLKYDIRKDNGNGKLKKMDGNSNKVGLIDLMHIFDTVINEVFGLMQDAFNRFKKTNDFEKVRKMMIKNK